MRVTIVGGGLAGLSCATELVEAGAKVTVLEAGARFGGQVRTTRESGFTVEDGAAALDPGGDAHRLCTAELQLAEAIVERRDLPTLVLLNGALDRLKSGETAALFGLPDRTDHGAPPVALRAGMDGLAQAMVARLRGTAESQSGTRVVALGKGNGGWRVYPEMGPAIASDAIVLALPPRLAAWLLHPVGPKPARLLSRLSARTAIVVSLGFPRGAVAHPLDATGFTVPREPYEPGLHSVAFASSQFEHAAPDDRVLLRAVIRPGRGELAGTTESQWQGRALRLLGPVLGIRGLPVGAWVARWTEALPDYGPRYSDRVCDAREALDQVGGVVVAGAAYDAWGIDGALRSGRAAATRLLERLSR